MPFHARVIAVMIVAFFIAFVIVLHWSQFSALLGIGTESASFTLQLKHPPLSVVYVSTVLVAAFALEFLPYMEELWRGLRAKP
jgi:TRAP-type C4-dicarboxylate transport system permease small subunit